MSTPRSSPGPLVCAPVMQLGKLAGWCAMSAPTDGTQVSEINSVRSAGDPTRKDRQVRVAPTLPAGTVFGT